jgi:hypothetical protein
MIICEGGYCLCWLVVVLGAILIVIVIVVWCGCCNEVVGLGEWG